MRKFFLVLLVMSSVALVGCAKMPQRDEYTKLAVAPTMQADDEHGLVVFLRESAFVGGGVSYYIYEDTQKIGVLRSGTWFMHKAKPGQHTYWAETESKDVTTVTVEPNKKYYVLGGVSMGAWAGRPTLKEVTEPVAAPLLKDLEYLQLRPNYEVIRERENKKAQQSN